MHSPRRRFFGLAVLSSMALAAIHAQPSPGKAASIAARPRLEQSEIEAVIGMARQANVIPPEFAADALITLVESGLIPDRRMQRNLLEEAFVIAGNAQEKIALKRGAGDSPVTGALHGAFRNGIDQASLRSRAVSAMLRIDASFARDLFERIELPIQPTPGSSPARQDGGSGSSPAREGGDCAQQTIPDLTLYYVTMWEVARSIPDRAQVEAFFAAHIPRFVSAAQITPLARVFMQIPGIERMPAVIDAFSSRLPDLIEDRRVFSSSFDQAIEAVGQLISSVAPSSRERLIQQSRAWVVRSVNHGVCAEPPKYSVSFDGAGHRPIPFVEPSERFNQEVAWRSRTPNARIDARVDVNAAGSSIHEPQIAKQEAAGSAAIVPNSSQYIEHFQTSLLLSRDDEAALDLARWRTEVERYITRLSEWNWPDQTRPTQVVSKIFYHQSSSASEARQDGALVLTEPRPSCACAKGAVGLTEPRPEGAVGLTEPRPEGAVALTEPRPEGAIGLTEPRPEGAVVLNEPRLEGAVGLTEPRLEGAVTTPLSDSDAHQAAPMPGASSQGPSNQDQPEVVGQAIVGQAILPAAAFEAARGDATRSTPADFYLEKSDLLAHVLFIERHAPAQPASGPVKINWSGARKPEGPRLEIPGRERVMTTLVDLFDGETARKVYEDRRLLWFSPVRDLLGTYDRTGNTFAIAELYAASHHPVLNLYGRLAKLIAGR